MNVAKAKSKRLEIQRLVSKQATSFLVSLGALLKSFFLLLFHSIAVVGLTVLLAIHEARKKQEEKDYVKKINIS